jgi:DNA-binding LacI/PurR family transcriptional regulator
MAKKSATILEVARKAGVTDATVSRALRNSPLVKPETRDRVWRAARELNYRANAAGRGLVTGKTQTLGIITPSLLHPINATMAECVQQILGEKNYGLLITSLDNHDELTVTRLRMLTEHCVDGIILAPTMSDKDTSCIEIIRQYQIPFVVSADVPDDPVSYASFDNYDGMVQLTRHLLDSGYRRPGLMTIWPSHGATPKLVKGFQDTLREAGEDPANFPVVYQEEFDDTRVRQTIQRFLDNPQFPIDGLIVTDTMVAMRVFLYLKSRNIPVGRRFGFAAGVDGPGFEEQSLSITTLSYPVMQVAQALVDMLLCRIENPHAPRETRYFKARLIVRDSTRRTGSQ